MRARPQTDLTPNDLELWTLDDAEAWKEAETGSTVDLWLEEDPVLDSDLWMEGADHDSLSLEGLGRLGVHIA